MKDYKIKSANKLKFISRLLKIIFLIYLKSITSTPGYFLTSNVKLDSFTA